MNSAPQVIPNLIINLHAVFSSAALALDQAHSIDLVAEGIPKAYYKANRRGARLLRANMFQFERSARVHCGDGWPAKLAQMSRKQAFKTNPPPALFEASEEKHVLLAVLANRTSVAAQYVLAAQEPILEHWGKDDLHWLRCQQFKITVFPHLMALHDMGAVDMEPVFGPIPPAADG